MKKVLLIGLIAVMALEMMACGSLGFEGTYKIETCDGEIWDDEEYGLLFYTFKDGTVTETFEKDGKVETYIGTYILDGNELTIIGGGDVSHWLPVWWKRRQRKPFHHGRRSQSWRFFKIRE